ncbi:plasmid fertility inhibition factor family protein [Burkholderia ubonensis]|uniref:plasmid fertility inhibition factor family protein n=1 Tax=Burkholderia ubonensis TaxID=101571 RepID=UPI0009B38A52|nr:hypothetical protein [Burkholderia ubonensis]
MALDQVQRHDANTWIVQLPGHEPYAFTRLKRVFSSDDVRHRVVVVDSRKLLACADRDTIDYVLPHVPYWHPGKVSGIREFLAPGQLRIPEMPHVTISTKRARTLLGLVGLSKAGVVSFRNGQHRARYLAFVGATNFPVEVHETEAALLEHYCGA